jgi:hypothetical protein
LFRLTITSAITSVALHPEPTILVDAEAKYSEIEYGWIESGELYFATLGRAATSG